MTQVFETQTILVDPNAAPVNLVLLDKDFFINRIEVITNTVLPSGVREITLGIHYDDAVTLQHVFSLETFKVGNNIADLNVALSQSATIQFMEFIDHTIVDDTISVTILSVGTTTAQVNNLVTRKFQLDPSNPITTGVPISLAGQFIESHLTNVGSLVNTSDVNPGTLNSIAFVVAQA